jgi:hypothetical protein
MTPENLSDDEFLVKWKRIEDAHSSAGDGGKDAAYRARILIEEEAIKRFGLGDHITKYNERFPPEVM